MANDSSCQQLHREQIIVQCLLCDTCTTLHTHPLSSLSKWMVSRDRWSTRSCLLTPSGMHLWPHKIRNTGHMTNLTKKHPSVNLISTTSMNTKMRPGESTRQHCTEKARHMNYVTMSIQSVPRLTLEWPQYRYGRAQS